MSISTNLSLKNLLIYSFIFLFHDVHIGDEEGCAEDFYSTVAGDITLKNLVGFCFDIFFSLFFAKG